MSNKQDIPYGSFIGVTIGDFQQNNYDDLLDMQRESDLFQKDFNKPRTFKFSALGGLKYIRSERKFAHRSEGEFGSFFITFDYKKNFIGVPYKKVVSFQFSNSLVRVLMSYSGNPELGKIIDFVPGKTIRLGNEVYVINREPKGESTYTLEAEAPTFRAMKRYVKDFSKKPVYSFPLAVISFLISLIALKNSLMGYSEYIFAIFHFASLYFFSSAVREN